MRNFGVSHRSFKNKFRGLTANDIVCVTVSATCAVSATDIIAEVVVSSVVVSTSGDFIADTISATGNITADSISALTGLETDGYVHADGAVRADTVSAVTSIQTASLTVNGDVSASGVVSCDDVIAAGSAHFVENVESNGDFIATGTVQADVNLSCANDIIGDVLTILQAGNIGPAQDVGIGNSVGEISGTGHLLMSAATINGAISSSGNVNVANMTAGTLSTQGAITTDGAISASGDVTGASGVFTDGLSIGGTPNYWAGDGTAYIEGRLTAGNVVGAYLMPNSHLFMANDVQIRWGTSENAYMRWETAEATDALHLLLDSAGKNFVIGDMVANDKAYDHGANASPTVFIHNATDPDVSNNLWGSLAHNGDGFILSTGVNTGVGTGPITVDNYFMVAPQGTEQVRVGSAGTQVTGAISGSGNISTAGATIAGDLQAHRFLTSASNDGGTLETTQFGTTVTVNSAQSVGVVLPSVATGDIGGWFRFMKLGAGTLAVCAADSDVIASATAGSAIYNAASAETYATLTLQLADATHWVITGAHGTWTTL